MPVRTALTTLIAATLVVMMSARQSTTERIGTGAITGTVLESATGRPVAGATLMLEERGKPGTFGRTRSQVTTPKGRFAFVDLPAFDNFILTVTKTGYLDGGFRRTDPRGPSAPIILKEGEWLDNVRIDLMRPAPSSMSVASPSSERMCACCRRC